MDDVPENSQSEPTGSTRTRLSGQARIALVGAVVAVVLAVGAIAAFWFVTRSSASAVDVVAGSAVASEPTASPAPTPTATSAPVATHSERPRQFRSESGNLQCSMWMYSGRPTAICQQTEVAYAIPDGACPSSMPGVFVGVTSEGPFWPCAGSWNVTEEVLPYDTAATYGDLTCSINYETGVTCTNARGQGFTMEYYAGIQFF